MSDTVIFAIATASKALNFAPVKQERFGGPYPRCCLLRANNGPLLRITESPVFSMGRCGREREKNDSRRAFSIISSLFPRKKIDLHFNPYTVLFQTEENWKYKRRKKKLRKSHTPLQHHLQPSRRSQRRLVLRAPGTRAPKQMLVCSRKLAAPIVDLTAAGSCECV